MYENRICPICQKQFFSTNGKTKYCCNECKNKAKKAQEKEWRQKNSKYMDEWNKSHPGYREKYDKANRYKYREKQNQQKKEKWRIEHNLSELTVVCKVCGFEFKTYRKSKACCSAECSKIWRKRQARNDIRLNKDNIIDADIELRELFNRDKGICHICGEKCDLDDYKIVNGKFSIGPHYPTIDHLSPISIGGKHSWQNVKLAHKKCNQVKGNKKRL